jgi:uncharacterized membrane protein YeaQ/YmgE (transglycosylase-associated protein family)
MVALPGQDIGDTIMVEKTEKKKSTFTNIMLIGLGGAMVGGTLHVLDATAYHQTVAIVGVVISVLGAYRGGA